MRWYPIDEIKEQHPFAMAIPDRFVTDNNFTRAVHYRDETKLSSILRSGSFTSWGYLREREGVPDLDHALIFKNTEDRVCALVYQPYCKAESIKDKIKNWANERGLCAGVYSEKNSWYYDTCLVVIHDKGKTIKVDGRETV